MKMGSNIILGTDSYKYTHWWQYPDNTQTVYSYWEARNGAKFNKTLFYGLQYYLKEYLAGQVVTKEKIDFTEQLALEHFGTLDGTFNRPMWEHILDVYGGRLPIRIKAVPEGRLIPVSNIMMSVENTDPICYQLTNHVETLLSKLWYPCTVGTLAWELAKLISDYTDWTSSFDGLKKFSIHDFGYRGTETEESAAVGGSAALISSLGTDTTIAMPFAMFYYNALLKGLGYSVKASEHSIMTSRGRDGEEMVVRDILRKNPTGIQALVIDSYNYRRFIEMMGTTFKDAVVNRKGKIVLRPDSGDPVSTSLEVVRSIAKYFGYTTNSKGYKELPPYVGMLWGDGINYDGIRNILFAFKNDGWATSNIVFGMGGALLQKVDRDTQRFAFKCSAQLRDGEWHDIFKDPLDGSKSSKPGRLKLSKNSDGHFFTVKDDSEDYRDYLSTVFENGEILKEYSFDEVRANAAEG